jgi:predicted O-methyltransferase YrrM
MNNFLDKISRIDGFLTVNEGKLLYDLAKKVKNGTIVEIGSWKGRSTSCLALGSKAGFGAKVYAIDPHTGSPEHQEAFKGNVWTFDIFKENMKSVGVNDVVVPILQLAHEASKTFNQKISLIFIDGAHEYEDVRKDFEDWFYKVEDGGIIALHDTVGWDGPRKVVEEFMYKSAYFSDVRFVDSITYGRKVKKNSRYDRVRNVCILHVRNISEYVRALTIPRFIKRIGKKVITFIQ